jgi:hypothetical protein
MTVSNTSDRNRINQTEPQECTYALHLEGPDDSVSLIRKKLKKWYGCGTKRFPDGTKMRLIPPFQSLIFICNKFL